MGYLGNVSISAYSDLQQNPKDFESSPITLFHTGDTYKKILMDFMLWALDQHQKPFNLMLISHDILKDKLYFESILVWNVRNGNIFLAQPENLTHDDLSRARHVAAVWLWKSLSSGGKPIDQSSISQPCRRRTTSSTSKPSAVAVQSKGKTPVQKKSWIVKVKATNINNPVSETQDHTKSNKRDQSSISHPCRRSSQGVSHRVASKWTTSSTSEPSAVAVQSKGKPPVQKKSWIVKVKTTNIINPVSETEDYTKSNT